MVCVAPLSVMWAEKNFHKGNTSASSLLEENSRILDVLQYGVL